MSYSLKVNVADKRQLADSIVLLELRAPDAAELPAFTPGSHITVALPGGVSRAYSLCNDPQERGRYQIAVFREPSSTGGSVAVHETVKRGDELTITGPFNHFTLDESAPHTILVAGGIGITPLRAMALRLHQIGASWELHYCTRTVARCAFRAELAEASFSDRVRLHFDDGAAEQRLDMPALLKSAAAQSHVYVCGPGGLIDHVLATGKENGWPEERLHYERFSAQPVAAGVARAFKLRLARSGRILDVPADKNAMDVILDADIDLAVSCEQGVCGTCITTVIDGVPDHRDQCLTTAERARSFTPCCSRSLSDMLTIDL